MLAIAKEIGATRRHLPHRVESIASGPGTLCQSAITPTPHFSQPKKDTHPRRKSSAQNACRRFLMLPAQHNLHIVHIIRNVDKTKLQNYWIVMGANTQKGPPSGGGGGRKVLRPYEQVAVVQVVEHLWGGRKVLMALKKSK